MCVFYVFTRAHLFVFGLVILVFCIFPLCYCLVVNTSAINCLESLVSETIYYVSSGMLNHTHSLAPFAGQRFVVWCMQTY